ncbi:MAG TPA: glycerol-3-phosphate acyltransferase [Terriglobia bacterium]|nr:glycerol-3-phosphate acyltransferase [Terriglobia bacterium]
MIVVLKFLAAFLIGAIPFAKIAMLGSGIDITRVGSKNPGFRNVSRVASRWRAAICLIGDVGKGLSAVWLLGRGETSALTLWGIGIIAVMGHCWSPFLGFNGGKGVATTFGVLLFLQPLITLICLPLYPILRIVGGKLKLKQEGAIASLSTATAISALVLALRGLEPGILAAIMLLIVLIRHTPNLRELCTA